MTPELLANFLINEANKIHFELAQKIGIIHSSGITAESELKRNQMLKFLEEVNDELISFGNTLDLTDVKTLMAVKSFFGPCVLYASPQRQIINRRLVGDIEN